MERIACQAGRSEMRPVVVQGCLPESSHLVDIQNDRSFSAQKVCDFWDQEVALSSQFHKSFADEFCLLFLQKRLVRRGEEHLQISSTFMGLQQDLITKMRRLADCQLSPAH